MDELEYHSPSLAPRTGVLPWVAFFTPTVLYLSLASLPATILQSAQIGDWLVICVPLGSLGITGTIFCICRLSKERSALSAIVAFLGLGLSMAWVASWGLTLLLCWRIYSSG